GGHATVNRILWGSGPTRSPGSRTTGASWRAHATAMVPKTNARNLMASLLLRRHLVFEQAFRLRPLRPERRSRRCGGLEAGRHVGHGEGHQQPEEHEGSDEDEPGCAGRFLEVHEDQGYERGLDEGD